MTIDCIENKPTPTCCAGCIEADCYGCDTAKERWHCLKQQELALKKKLLIRAITRYQQEIEEIDRQLTILIGGRNR